MLERIWSGWRASYVTDVAPTRRDTAGAESSSSVFRQLLESGRPDDETYIVHRGESVFAIVNIHPYTSGHVLIVPYREVADLDGLTSDELGELWSTVTHAVGVVRVQRLRRVAVGPIRDNRLGPGDFRELSAKEVELLRATTKRVQSPPRKTRSRPKTGGGPRGR